MNHLFQVLLTLSLGIMRADSRRFWYILYFSPTFNIHNISTAQEVTVQALLFSCFTWMSVTTLICNLWFIYSVFCSFIWNGALRRVITSHIEYNFVYSMCICIYISNMGTNMKSTFLTHIIMIPLPQDLDKNSQLQKIVLFLSLQIQKYHNSRG